MKQVNDLRNRNASKILERKITPSFEDFDWGVSKKKSPGATGAKREGVNLALSSYIETKKNNTLITLSFSADLLKKMRWNPGDRVAVGVSKRADAVVIGVRLSADGRSLSATHGRLNASCVVAIPYLEDMPIYPIKYTLITEPGLNFSTPGMLTFVYPENAEINVK